MGLAEFITHNAECILSEFVAFASQQLPAAAEMDNLALRDHAAQVLAAIALDMAQAQTGVQQRQKSFGRPVTSISMDTSAADVHGELRATAGFDLNQTIGEYRALRASVIRLWLESGPQLGPGEVFEIVRFNEAMDEALAASMLRFAEEAAHMRNVFLGVLSHELRTPLSTIVASAHSLSKAAREHKALPEAAERVLRGGKRIESLLDDLLDYVRSGLGEGLRVTPAPVDIGTVCTRIVAELQTLHATRLIELHTVGDLACHCDEQRIAQAVSNLVNNAHKYGTPGLPVRVSASGEAPGEIVIEVQNAGPTIPKHARDTMFDPLVRGAGVEMGGFNLGLGLYIVRQIAVAHGGHASVRSEPDLGTVFTIRWPRDSGSATPSAFADLHLL